MLAANGPSTLVFEGIKIVVPEVDSMRILVGDQVV